MSLAIHSNAAQSSQQPDASASAARASSTNLASVNGQIQQDKQQLDDWTTCVSAKTVKGQAEIERLSGALSGAEEQAKRLAAQQPKASIDVWA